MRTLRPGCHVKEIRISGELGLAPVLFLPTISLQFIKASSPSPAHARESGFHVSVLLADSHLSLRLTWAWGAPHPGLPSHSAQIPPVACCLSSAGRWPFVLGNSLPWNCKSGFWELRTESGRDHVASTYLWTNLTIPCPRHIASPWQSETRVWAPDVWVLAQSSNCLL